MGKSPKIVEITIIVDGVNAIQCVAKRASAARGSKYTKYTFQTSAGEQTIQDDGANLYQLARTMLCLHEIGETNIAAIEAAATKPEKPSKSLARRKKVAASLTKRQAAMLRAFNRPKSILTAYEEVVGAKHNKDLVIDFDRDKIVLATSNLIKVYESGGDAATTLYVCTPEGFRTIQLLKNGKR